MCLNILIASDSYKSSLSSMQANTCIEKGILKVFPDAKVKLVSIADGGEGTVEACSSTIKETKNHIKYGVNDDTCFIEMASVNGILEDMDKSIFERNTYKTGRLILDMLDLGFKNIVIGIGGSGTNDCGLGMAKAFGYRFLDENNKEVAPYIKNVVRMKSIDKSQVDSRIFDANILVLSDVQNYLLGPAGCAKMFGKQKGATDKNIEELEKLDEMFLKLCAVSDFKGAGASGGLGLGLSYFAHAKIVSGIEYVIKKMEYEIEKYDLIITGEGCIDEQSLYGKVISGIQKLGDKYNVPVLCIGGSVKLKHPYEILYGSCVKECCELDQALKRAEENLVDTTVQCMNLIKCGMRVKK